MLSSKNKIMIKGLRKLAVWLENLSVIYIYGGMSLLDKLKRNVNAKDRKNYNSLSATQRVRTLMQKK